MSAPHFDSWTSAELSEWWIANVNPRQGGPAVLPGTNVFRFVSLERAREICRGAFEHYRPHDCWHYATLFNDVYRCSECDAVLRDAAAELAK